MRYCKNCLLPDTRPNLKIGINGICDACLKNPVKQNGAQDLLNLNT